MSAKPAAMMANILLCHSRIETVNIIFTRTTSGHSCGLRRSTQHLGECF